MNRPESARTLYLRRLQENLEVAERLALREPCRPANHWWAIAAPDVRRGERLGRDTSGRLVVSPAR